MKKLTTIANHVEISVQAFIKSEEARWHHLDIGSIGSWDYKVKIVDDTVQVWFDGGNVWSQINEHYNSDGDCDQYFSDEVATKIFGLDALGLRWEMYGTYRFDIYREVA